MDLNKQNGNGQDNLFDKNGNYNPNADANNGQQQGGFNQQQFDQNLQTPQQNMPPTPQQGGFDQRQFEQNLQTPPPYNNGYDPYNNNQPNQQSALAIVSLILGIISILFFCCCWFIPVLTGIGAVVCGLISLNNKEPLRGLAIAGIVLGGVGLALRVIFLVLTLVFSAANPAESFMDGFLDGLKNG